MTHHDLLTGNVQNRFLMVVLLMVCWWFVAVLLPCYQVVLASCSSTNCFLSSTLSMMGWKLWHPPEVGLLESASCHMHPKRIPKWHVGGAYKIGNLVKSDPAFSTTSLPTTRFFQCVYISLLYFLLCTIQTLGQILTLMSAPSMSARVYAREKKWNL